MPTNQNTAGPSNFRKQKNKKQEKNSLENNSILKSRKLEELNLEKPTAQLSPVGYNSLSVISKQTICLYDIPQELEISFFKE